MSVPGKTDLNKDMVIIHIDQVQNMKENGEVMLCMVKELFIIETVIFIVVGFSMVLSMV